MNRLIRRAAIVTVACMVASMTFAGPPMGHSDAPFGHSPEKILRQMTDRLDLSEDQQSHIAQLLKSEHKKMRSERDQLKNLRDQLKPDGEEFNTDKAREAADEIGVISGNMAYARASTMAKINTILTDDQQKNLHKLSAERDCRREGKNKRP